MSALSLTSMLSRHVPKACSPSSLCLCAMQAHSYICSTACLAHVHVLVCVLEFPYLKVFSCAHPCLSALQKLQGLSLKGQSLGVAPATYRVHKQAHNNAGQQQRQQEQQEADVEEDEEENEDGDKTESNEGQGGKEVSPKEVWQAVTPLARVPYEQQLKQKAERVKRELSRIVSAAVLRCSCLCKGRGGGQPCQLHLVCVSSMAHAVLSPSCASDAVVHTANGMLPPGDLEHRMRHGAHRGRGAPVALTMPRTTDRWTLPLLLFRPCGSLAGEQDEEEVFQVSRNEHPAVDSHSQEQR